MRTMHVLPKFADRWTHLYLEHGRLDKKDSSLALYTVDGETRIPVDQLGLVMLGPGTRVTHQAIKTLAENNCLVAWTGEMGVRMYAHSTGGTHISTRLLHQARMFCDDQLRLAVIKRMYQKRFDENVEDGRTIEQIRGMEGARVRKAYRQAAAAHGVEWKGRNYDQDAWDNSDPLNRALSAANACLYGLCHAAIVSAGYSAAIGFIHTGKMLSFVYDIADLYKTEITVPLAFDTAAGGGGEVERRTRIACRDAFFESKLIGRILPDIAEVLNVGDDLGEVHGELEGRIVTLADRAQVGSVPWQSEREGEGRALEDDQGEDRGGGRDPDME